MSAKIFVNLPVKDLKKSIAFFTRLGYKFNKEFTDETATCMVVSKHIFVMLLTTAKFKSFAPNAVCDAKKANEVLLCLDAGSRAKVDALVKKAVAGGGREHGKPKDFGFMYYRAYQDLDGHVWELMHMSGKPPKA